VVEYSSSEAHRTAQNRSWNALIHPQNMLAHRCLYQFLRSYSRNSFSSQVSSSSDIFC
jgi:hypothetical protein